MLGDHDAAQVAQRGGGVPLLRGVGPGAHELDLHGSAGAHALGAQIVGGEAGDHFREGIGAHIADHGLLGGDVAVVDHLLHLHAGHHAGQITALVDVGEGVVGVLQPVVPGALVGAGDELHLGIIGSHLQHVRLKAVGVVDDEVAALLGQLDIGVLTAGVLADVPLDDPLHLDAFGGQRLGGGLLAADKVVGIALVVLVADADEAHLHGLGRLSGVGGRGSIRGGGGGGGRGGAAGAAGACGEAQRHGACQEQGKNTFLHSFHSSSK